MAAPPSAIRAPALIATVASISGRGLESAKMIWPRRICSGSISPGTPGRRDDDVARAADLLDTRGDPAVSGQALDGVPRAVAPKTGCPCSA